MEDKIYIAYKKLLNAILSGGKPRGQRADIYERVNSSPRRVPKRCRVCGNMLDVGYRKRKRGLMCDVCYRAFNRERARVYYKEHPDRVKATIKRSEDKYPEKQQARVKANICYPRPHKCSIVGCTNTGQRHHGNYNNPTSIVWLCAYHHHKLHKDVL